MASSGETKRFENWMSELPEPLQNMSLTRLAIPGSHKSYTYNLKPFAELDGPAPCCAHCLGLCCGCVGRGRVYQWSMTQSKEIFDQLELGIRYFDLQIIFRYITNDFFCINALYAMRVSELLSDMMLFLKAHPKEVVILDFNQVLNMKKESLHERFDGELNDIFGSLVVKSHNQDVSDLSLKQLWTAGKQVIIIYNHDVLKKCAFDTGNLFPNTVIDRQINPTTSTNRMVHNLETRFHTKPTDVFTVWPSYLTPTSATIAGRLCGSIQEKLAPKAGQAFIEWLKGKQEEQDSHRHHRINICCIDFFEMFDYVPTVLSLNKVLD